MKKWLLFLVVCGSAFSIQSQSYKTVHCYDDCKYIYYDTMAYYSVDDDNFRYEKHLWANLKMGFYRFGELLSIDTTNALGYIELDIPDMQETDIYNLTLFYEYKRIYGCSFGGGGGYQLDTNYIQSDNGWIAHHIMCKEHGRMSDSTLVDEIEMSELSIDIFPIPTYEQLTLRFSKPFSGTCSILQLSGIQAQSLVLNNQENFPVDVSALSGTYIVVVYDENGAVRERKKIVVL